MADTRPWPPLAITLTDDGAIITEAGIPSRTIAPGPTVHSDAIAECVTIARRYRRALPVTATGPEGTFHLVVSPDGHINDLTGTITTQEPPVAHVEDTPLTELADSAPVLPYAPRRLSTAPTHTESSVGRHEADELANERSRLAHELSEAQAAHAAVMRDIQGRERAAAAAVSALQTELESSPNPNDVEEITQKLRVAHRARTAIRDEREELTDDFSHLQADLTARIVIIDKLAPNPKHADNPQAPPFDFEKSSPIPSLNWLRARKGDLRASQRRGRR